METSVNQSSETGHPIYQAEVFALFKEQYGGLLGELTQDVIADKLHEAWGQKISSKEVSKIVCGNRTLRGLNAQKFYAAFFAEAVCKKSEAERTDCLNNLKERIETGIEGDGPLTFSDWQGREGDTCESYLMRMLKAAFKNLKKKKKAASKKSPSKDEQQALGADETEYLLEEDGKIERLDTFTGREELLDKIQKLLDKHGRVALTGIGGIGKSTLVQEFAVRKREEERYSPIQMVPGEKGSSFKDAILELRFKGLDDKKEPPNERYQRRKDLLLRHDERTLIIIDNVDKEWEDIKEFNDLRSKLKCHFIITSRVNLFSPCLPVEDLSTEERRELFFRHYKGKAPNSALLDEVLNRTEGHPLLIELIAKMRFTKFEKILKWLDVSTSDDKSKEGALKRAKERIHTLLFRVKMNDDQKSLLRRLTFLPDEGVPSTLLPDILKGLYSSPADDLLDYLVDYSWLIFKNGQIQIHSLIRKVVERDIPPEWWEWAVHCDFLKNIRTAMKAEDLDEDDQKSLGLLALNMCKALRNKSGIPLDLWDTLNEIVKSCKAAYQYKTALDLCDLLSDIEEHAETEKRIDLHLQIGSLHRQLAEYKDAIEHYQVALGMTQRDDDWRGSCYYSMGVVFRKDGYYEKAGKYFDNALCCYKNQDLIAEAQDDLGVVYRHLGEMETEREQREYYYQQAKGYAEEVLANREKLGTDAKALAFSYHRIGSACYGLGEYERALAEHKRAEELRPGKAVSYNCIGDDLLRLGRLDEAKENLDKSMDIRKKYLGERHPDVAKSLISLGEYYETIRDLDKAIEKTREAYNIRVKGLRPGHPYIAQAKRRLEELERKKQAPVPSGQEKRQ